MSVITSTAEKLTDPNMLISARLWTETQKDPNDLEAEQYRAVFQIVIERDAFNMVAFSQPTDELVSRENLPVRFNETTSINLLPLKSSTGSDTYPFKLVEQGFAPKGQRGSQFVNLTQTYTSTSPWLTLEWT